MKDGLVVLLVFLLSLGHSASAADSLNFLDLGNYSTVDRNESSSFVYSGESIPFGYSRARQFYVSTSGYFSIGRGPPDVVLFKFSSLSSYSVVAPYAADIDITNTGSVRYQTFSTGEPNINAVSTYIRSEQGVSFYGRWMLVAEWNGVPLYGGSNLTTNTFQGIIISDTGTTYAVFLYYCPYMEWSGFAVIGWQYSSSYYRNHPLSGTSDAKEVACLNTNTSYNTVLFKLTSVKRCSGSFGCFDGDCEYFARCDGESDCSDGSDEVACSFSECDPGEIQCDNSKSNPESDQCDNSDDCDEEGNANLGLVLGLCVGVIVAFPVCSAILSYVFNKCLKHAPEQRPVRTHNEYEMTSIRTQTVSTTPPAAGTTVVTTAQTTSAAAPATQPVQQQYPAEFKAGPQEAPPPYPGQGYPVYHHPTPQYCPQQVQTLYDSEEAPPPYPAFPPPTQNPPPTVQNSC